MAFFDGNIDYTDKDFDSLRARLFNLIRSAFPTWTEQEIANFGNIMVEAFAFVGDVLGFYQDNQARESRIVTAEQRRNLLALAKLVGYKAQGQSAASVDLTLTLSQPPVGDVNIAIGDTFRTLEITEPVVFQSLEAASIPAGTNPPTVTFAAENSDSASESFPSTGLPSQELLLSETPYLDNSLVITAGNGAYTVVDDFLDSGSGDRHVTVVVDENDQARVRFGNGIAGAIPLGTIVCDYKTGGGPQGNVEENSIRRVDKTYVDSFSNPVTPTVSNVNRASGGDTRQSVASIKESAPRSTRVLNRTVAREDYEINALKVSGVARAVMLTSNERPGILENQGQLVVLPDGGGMPSAALKQAVLNEVTVTFPNTLTFLVEVIDPDFVTVDISAKVRLGTGVSAVVADAAIRAAIQEFFALQLSNGAANPSMDFGYVIDGVVAFSDVYNLIRDTAGVRRMSDAPDALLLNLSASDVDVDVYQFPVLGTVVLLNDETSLPLVP